MPYIDKSARGVIETQMRLPLIDNAGQLNYCMTRLAQHYLECQAGVTGEYRYQHFNDIVGAMECCKAELYRRLIAKLEDRKCELNGDVF